MKTSFGSAALVGLALSSAMAFYAVSLHVAAERAGIEKVRAQIVADSHDIRMLQAELRTRARLPELQRWNEQVLALAPPKPSQFIDSPLVLASYTQVPAAGTPAVRFVAAHGGPKAASLIQQVAFRAPSSEAAAPAPAQHKTSGALPPMTVEAAPTTAAKPTAAHRTPKAIVVASAEPTAPPSIGLDATLGGQLAAAAAQEHVTRASYTLR